MAHAINRYKADLRDYRFLLFEQFGLGDLLGNEPYVDWDEETVVAVIDELYRFACDVTGPLNQNGDQQGCRVEDGRVKTPDGFPEAWKKLYEAGWKSLTVAEEWGGQGAPRTLGVCAEELLSGSNTSFSMYPGLTVGAAELIEEFGTDRQKKLYLEKMFNGTWSGTMCLTEAEAGSDVGAATTSAKKLEDGRYAITGGKIFISAGDADVAENVIHLALARIDGAMAGTKGLSLFIVPRVSVDEDGKLLEDNDIKVAGIEHKMGINGSATCQLAFGEDGGCIGELVGGAEHQGMRQMFHMMNTARIGVGLQGLAVASSAYLNALEYAKERKQGSSIKDWKNPEAPRVAIIQHPNVRQDLLDMKARVEGIRALIVKLAMHQDRFEVLEGKDDEAAAYHAGQVDLLTPLVKAYSSDQSFLICAKAISVYGGAGYLQDHPVEQYCRDSKIFSIYEGTNAIQSLDLVGRKLGQGGGKNTQAFLGDIQKFIGKYAEDEELALAVKSLKKAHEAVGGTTMQFLGWFQSGQMQHIPLCSERFLSMMSELAVGWLLLEQAVIAREKLKDVSETHPDVHFYNGKISAARYFAINALPFVVANARAIAAADESAIQLTDEAFGNI
ncbi:MAG: acyl-CoA dehydrogenase [Deltaproteobacteria bacterium]|nr:acyl-CoA dehydrogenase [Deltaproteobacteria bacterium]